MAGRWPSSPATPWRWPSSAPASTRTTAARCASPATARTASREVDGVAYVRTCQTPARPGLVVRRHPAVGAPGLRQAQPDVEQTPSSHVAVRRIEADVVVIGAGDSGRAAAHRAEAAGRAVVVLDAAAATRSSPSIGGPTVIVRRAGTQPIELCTSTPTRSSLATGAAELHPVCPGNHLSGLFTARAAATAHAAGVELPDAIAVGPTLQAVPDGLPCRRCPGA